MANETSKCHAMREARGDFKNFLKGSGIDIGAGDDPLNVPGVRAWDMKDGDAMLLSGVTDNSFDFVYSSHCLEHMVNVEEALTNWARVLKPGGYLYFVVPDFHLYEQEHWTSIYNADHKASFSLFYTRDDLGRESHFGRTDINNILQKLNCSVESAELEDEGYDYSLRNVDQTRTGAMAQICFIVRKNQ